MRHFLGERVSPAQVRLAGIVARLVLRLVGCRDPNNEEEVSSAAVNRHNLIQFHFGLRGGHGDC